MSERENFEQEAERGEEQLKALRSPDLDASALEEIAKKPESVRADAATPLLSPQTIYPLMVPITQIPSPDIAHEGTVAESGEEFNPLRWLTKYLQTVPAEKQNDLRIMVYYQFYLIMEEKGLIKQGHSKWGEIVFLAEDTNWQDFVGSVSPEDLNRYRIQALANVINNTTLTS